MRLIYKIILSLSIPLVITLGLWGWLSYRTMSERIHKDTDMILKDYSDQIVSRKLSGQEIPDRFNGAYNTYYIKEVTDDYAMENLRLCNESVRVIKLDMLKSSLDFASYSLNHRDNVVDKFIIKLLFAIGMDDWDEEFLLPIVRESGEIYERISIPRR